MSNQYTGITNAISLAKHAEENIEFNDAYGKNPQAAVAKFSSLFNMQLDVDISFQDEGYEVMYDRVMRQ